MFDFFVRKIFVNSTQKGIERLNPSVTIHVPPDLPFPSIGIVKRMSVVASKINSLEPVMEKLSNDDLRAKTEQFRRSYREAVAAKIAELKDAKEVLDKAIEKQERTDAEVNFDRVKEELKKAKQDAGSFCCGS